MLFPVLRGSLACFFSETFDEIVAIGDANVFTDFLDALLSACKIITGLFYSQLSEIIHWACTGLLFE